MYVCICIYIYICLQFINITESATFPLRRLFSRQSEYNNINIKIHVYTQAYIYVYIRMYTYIYNGLYMYVYICIYK